MIISGLLDTFTYLRRHKLLVTIGYCVVCYLLALPLCAPVDYLMESEREDRLSVPFQGGIYLFVSQVSLRMTDRRSSSICRH